MNVSHRGMFRATIPRRAVFLAVFLPFAAAAQDDFLRVRAEGRAAGTGLIARDRAIASAQRDALAIAVESILPGDPAARAAVLDRAGDYVQSSRALEIQQEGGETRVFVEALLRRAELRRDLAAHVIRSSGRRPKVVFLVSEQVAGQPPRSLKEIGIVETLIIDGFRTMGLEVAPPDTMRAGYTAQELNFRLQSNDATSARFARENLADAAVTGSASTRLLEAGAAINTVKVQAAVTLRAVRSHDAALLETVTAEAVVHGADPAAASSLALADAAQKARDRLFVGIVLGTAGAARTEWYTLLVQRPRDRKQIDDLTALLRDAAGDVELLKLTPEQALFRFTYAGRLAALVDRIVPPGERGLGLEAVHIVGNEMVFRPVER